MKRLTRKQLEQEIERLEWLHKSQERTIKDLRDFIAKNKIVCPECGESGDYCHNYQG